MADLKRSAKMIWIYGLLFRVLAGERYAPPSKEDTRLWLSLFAAVPPTIGAFYVWAGISREWSLLLILLSDTALLCGFFVVWFFITRLPGFKSIIALAVIGWIAAFSAAYYLA